jgi:hypothetical protein
MIKTRYQSGSAHIISIFIVVFVLVGALGWVFWQNFGQKQQIANTNQSKDVAASEQQVIVPSEWKKFGSKQYGIGFSTPGKWDVSEYDESKNSDNGFGLLYTITVCATSNCDTKSSIKVYKLTLDERVRFALAMSLYGVKELKVQDVKWHGHEARRVSGKQGGVHDEYSNLFVRVGNYTYEIPDADYPEDGSGSDAFDLKDFSIYAGTLDIKES